MKRILVTGAAGFIGSHVVEKLLDFGEDVVGLDNFSEYYNSKNKQKNIIDIQKKHPNFRCIRGDIRDTITINSLCLKHNFDTIVHLAGSPGVRTSIGNAREYYDVNVIGSINLLDAARKHNIKTFIFASTSSVYGNVDKKEAFVETDNCHSPLAPYPASKQAVETLGYTYHKNHDIHFTALRFFTVYGPRNRPDMMAHKLLDSVVNQTPIELYNNGDMKRDWTYVDDIVNGILGAIDLSELYAIFNLGRGQPVILNDFVSIIEKTTNRKAILINKPMHEADVSFTHANINLARSAFGYCPTVSIEDGVLKLWNWYKLFHDIKE
jgi:UDP-glucuronate 4-epimerase